MADSITLEFIAKPLDRAIANQAEMHDDIRVLTGIVLRHENTLRDVLEQITGMGAQHHRFRDRLRRLEDQPAQ